MKRLELVIQERRAFRAARLKDFFFELSANSYYSDVPDENDDETKEEPLPVIGDP